MSDEPKAAEKPAEEQVSASKPVAAPGTADSDGAAEAWAERASEEVARKPSDRKPSDKAPEKAPEKTPVKAPEKDSAKTGDDVEPEFSITGSLPEPKIKMLAVLAAVVLALDVLTKVLSVAFLEGAEPIQLFGGVLYLTFVRNPGAAFGMAEGMTWVLALIALGVAGYILWISRNLRSQPWAVGLGLVLGGAVGNLADRLFREPGPMRGHVVDFLSLFDPFGRVWPVFNVADMAIVCGGATIVVLALLQRDYDGTMHKESQPPVEQGGLEEPR